MALPEVATPLCTQEGEDEEQLRVRKGKAPRGSCKEGVESVYSSLTGNPAVDLVRKRLLPQRCKGKKKKWRYFFNGNQSGKLIIMGEKR
jgi:hypothetical protein